MNNELIIYPPIEDEQRDKNTLFKLKKSRTNAIPRILATILSLNFLLCTVFFAANRIDASEITQSIASVFLFGEASEHPKQERFEGTDNEAHVPVAADPMPLDKNEEKDDDAAVAAIAEEFIKLYEYDLSLVPEGLLPIIPYDLSSEPDGVLKLFNDTDLETDVNEYAKAEITEEAIAGSEEPLVLIIHTHGTEAYSEDGALGYSDTYNIPRSQDVTKNVIAIGRIMARVMNENGVSTLQCDVMHDAQSYLGAYERSAQTVNDYLERYPSIKYVFDVHRDSVLLEDKTKTRPVTIAEGKVAAQIMTVVGSDRIGTYHPDWEQNLTLAAKLQTKLNAEHLGLARAICLRGSSYNQELAPYSLLFEVGSCGNTFAEAAHSAEILATELAEIIKNGW